MTSNKSSGDISTGNNISSCSRPNIIIILADDLGFSDISCFGSEVSTPNIDSLANNGNGIRFTQMYNCARCCPSRASLLTGKYPHQAGIGHMVYNAANIGKEYQGYLRKDVATIAEMLKREHTNTINYEDSIKREHTNTINEDSIKTKERICNIHGWKVACWRRVSSRCYS